MLQPYLVISTENTPDVSESLSTIFATVMSLGLLDVDVLIKNSNTSNWSIYFYKPYVQHCHSFEIVKVDTFSPENFTNGLNMSSANLYAPREFKFPHCWLYVSTFSFEPFVIIRNESNRFVTYDGIDVKLVNEICKKLKLVPMYIQPPDKKNRGKVFKNGTATGAIKMVKEKNVIKQFICCLGNEIICI